MKGERTIDDKPFRYGGIMHDYDKTSEDWATYMPEHFRPGTIALGAEQKL